MCTIAAAPIIDDPIVTGEAENYLVVQQAVARRRALQQPTAVSLGSQVMRVYIHKLVAVAFK
jgi:hypothetical protein